MQSWAVFDVDGTLFPPSSMEKTFMIFMLKHGILPARNIFYYFLIGGIKTAQTNYEEGFKNNKFYLKDLPVKSVQTAAGKFVRQQVWPRISPTGLNHLQEYRKRGYRILLMSGSPDFLTLPLSRFLRPDHVITAELEIKNHRFTGFLKNLHPYGERKTRMLHQYQDILRIDYHHSIVYANHQADFHHMNLFGRKVAVNPTPKLRTLAEQADWEIELWEEPS